jgi:hypothetical protein
MGRSVVKLPSASHSFPYDRSLKAVEFGASFIAWLGRKECEVKFCMWGAMVKPEECADFEGLTVVIPVQGFGIQLFLSNSIRPVNGILAMPPALIDHPLPALPNHVSDRALLHAFKRISRTIRTHEWVGIIDYDEWRLFTSDACQDGAVVVR